MSRVIIDNGDGTFTIVTTGEQIVDLDALISAESRIQGIIDTGYTDEQIMSWGQEIADRELAEWEAQAQMLRDQIVELAGG